MYVCMYVCVYVYVDYVCVMSVHVCKLCLRLKNLWEPLQLAEVWLPVQIE